LIALLSCERRDNHSTGRWFPKTDPPFLSTGASAIEAVAPLDVFSWRGPDTIGNNSFVLTGRVILVKVEADGDLHITLQDATRDKPGIIVAEIPAKPQWCELRQIVFGWTKVQFPFRVRSGRKLKLIQLEIITVIGKAFFDNGHAPADHSNRRSDFYRYAAWKIHPVMKLTVH
jgi:hypothetical protein